MTKQMNNSVSRLLILLAVCWLGGMGWYQFQYEPSQKSEKSFSISFNDDSEISIDSSGIKKTDKNQVRMEKLAIVALPAILLLLLIPAYGWVAAGFNSKGNKND